jgi:3-hydroxybutyryl-CoA dehydrogenase
MLKPTSAAGAIAVIGGGTMGVGIAYVFAVAGSPVSLVEPSETRRSALNEILSKAAESGVSRGKLTEAQAREVERRIEIFESVDALTPGFDLIVETVPEFPALKQTVLTKLGALEPRLLATNTSSISIDDLSRWVAEPSRFLGMHFFNPVWSLPLVELVRGAATSPESLDLARRFAEAAGKTTIVSRDVPGFATSRLDVLSAMEAIRMLEDGVASAEDIDKAMVVAFRHPVGPLRLCDIVGLDVRLQIATYLAGALGERYAPPQLLKDKVARNELGVKSGHGFYDWPDAHYFISKPPGETS